jgi:hypothetical protein
MVGAFYLVLRRVKMVSSSHLSPARKAVSSLVEGRAATSFITDLFAMPHLAKTLANKLAALTSDGIALAS